MRIECPRCENKTANVWQVQIEDQTSLQRSFSDAQNAITPSENTLNRKVFSQLNSTLEWFSSLPVFHCTVCGRKLRSDYEISCTGDVKRNVQKAPECCGKAMIEIIED